MAFLVTLLALFVSTIAYQLPARTAGSEARALASWIESNNRAGPIAGSAMRPGGRVGLYAAWFLGDPWLGDSRTSDVLPFVRSGARLLVFSSGDPLILELNRETELRRLELPQSLADKFVVFEIKH